MVCALVILGTPDTTAALQPGSDVTIKISYKDKSYVGKPLAWDGDDLMLLRRDGKISILPVKSHADYKTVDDRFQPYDTDVMR